MKPVITALIVIAVLWLGPVLITGNGQSSSVTPRYEVAIIKWDGPDRIQFITPQKSEVIRLFKQGVQLPPDIRDEEFSLAEDANSLAQEGWEPVNLNATRILLRRAAVR